MKKIVYVGLKDSKGDNIGQTGLVWTRGQVHEVQDEKIAAKLLEHPLIWRDATGKNADEIESMLIQMPTVVSQQSVIKIMPAPGVKSAPFIVPANEETLEELHAGLLEVIYLTPEESQQFYDWKIAKDGVLKSLTPAPKVEKKKFA